MCTQEKGLTTDPLIMRVCGQGSHQNLKFPFNNVVQLDTNHPMLMSMGYIVSLLNHKKKEKRKTVKTKQTAFFFDKSFSKKKSKCKYPM